MRDTEKRILKDLAQAYAVYKTISEWHLCLTGAGGRHGLPNVGPGSFGLEMFLFKPMGKKEQHSEVDALLGIIGKGLRENNTDAVEVFDANLPIF